MPRGYPSEILVSQVVSRTAGTRWGGREGQDSKGRTNSQPARAAGTDSGGFLEDADLAELLVALADQLLRALGL